MIVRARKRRIPDPTESTSVSGSSAPSDVIVLDLSRTIEDRIFSGFSVLVSVFYVLVIGFTWKQAILGILVDLFALAVALKLQPSFVWNRTPQFKAIFPTLKFSRQEGQMLSESARVELFRLLRTWPYERAKNAFVMSLLKSIPVSVLALFIFDRVFFWPIHASLYLVVVILLQLDFTFLCYVQAHEDISRFFKQVHQRDDWTTTFERVGDDEPDVMQFKRVETIGFWGIFLVTILGVTTVSIGREWASKGELLGSVILVVALAAGLLAQLISIHRRFLVGGLVKIIRSFGALDAGAERGLIALSSWSLFAGFENAFNRLVRRLDRREREVGRLLNRFAEESRLLTLGEISGLVVHDLGNTLHMAQFAAASLDRCQDPVIEKKLKGELQISLDRLGALISTLRLRLESRPGLEVGANLGVIQAHVCRFLELQFKEVGFVQSRWMNSDLQVHRVRVAMPPSELFQLLENLFRNSVQAVLRAQRSEPRVGIRVLNEPTPGFVLLEVFDNGFGLSAERFSQLTASDGQEGERSSSERGLGLRLTRRLVEQYGGALLVNAQSELGQNEAVRAGASFLVRLPGEIIPEDDREQLLV